MRGEIGNFTGVSSPYERPEQPGVHLDAGRHPPDECVEMVMREL